jgi:hypothetical protein
MDIRRSSIRATVGPRAVGAAEQWPTMLAASLMVACATSSSRPAESADAATEPREGNGVSAASLSTPASATPSAEATAALELPCSGSNACPHQARFASVVTLYAGPRSAVAFALDTPRTYSWNPHGDPRVANPDDEASRAHVVCRSDELTTQVFVEWTDVLPVATDFVLATPTLERADDDGAPGIGVSLAPGAVLDVKREEGALVEVGFHEEVVEGSGWVPRASVGRTFVEPEMDPRELPKQDRIQVQWGEGTPVRDRPGGRAFAKVAGPATVQPLGQTRGKHLLGAVAFVLEQRTYAVGWIPVAAIEAGRMGGVFGGVIGGRPEGTERVTIPAGTRLSSETGEDVAVATGDVTLVCLSDCETPTPVVEIRCVGTFPARVVGRAGV